MPSLHLGGRYSARQYTSERSFNLGEYVPSPWYQGTHTGVSSATLLGLNLGIGIGIGIGTGIAIDTEILNAMDFGVSIVTRLRLGRNFSRPVVARPD